MQLSRTQITLEGDVLRQGGTAMQKKQEKAEKTEAKKYEDLRVLKIASKEELKRIVGGAPGHRRHGGPGGGGGRGKGKGN